ncbi:MAG: aminoglycoside phosphotransferase family protein, partial [Ardenticatenales bacterium]|nr:aminoglycoside phosphotransferase family protein [Ardenticatenales bacterium]
SCVLRAPTTTGAVYFKVSSTRPLFSDEPEVTQGLAARFPDDIPRPLSVDAARGWMLLADFGEPLRGNATVEIREALFQRFGELQRHAAEQVKALLGMGCLDRRLERLATQIDPLLDDAPMMALLKTEEVAQLRALAPRLKALCAEASTYRVPPSLVHGDLHLGNVAQQEGRYLIFDWTDSCITHPFIDLIDLIYEKEEAVRDRLLDGYLALWTDYEPMARLKELWELVKPLCALHQVISYQHIVNSLEPASKQELIEGFTDWTHLLLAMFAQGNISVG